MLSNFESLTRSYLRFYDTTTPWQWRQVPIDVFCLSRPILLFYPNLEGYCIGLGLMYLEARNQDSFWDIFRHFCFSSNWWRICLYKRPSVLSRESRKLSILLFSQASALDELRRHLANGNSQQSRSLPTQLLVRALPPRHVVNDVQRSDEIHSHTSVCDGDM